MKTTDLRQTAAERGKRNDNKTQPKTPDSLRPEASQAAGAAPTLRYGPAGDSAPRLRLKAAWERGERPAFGEGPLPSVCIPVGRLPGPHAGRTTSTGHDPRPRAPRLAPPAQSHRRRRSAAAARGNCILAQPDRDVSAAPEATLVLPPVPDSVLRLVLAVDSARLPCGHDVAPLICMMDRNPSPMLACPLTPIHAPMPVVEVTCTGIWLDLTDHCAEASSSPGGKEENTGAASKLSDRLTMGSVEVTSSDPVKLLR